MKVRTGLVSARGGVLLTLAAALLMLSTVVMDPAEAKQKKDKKVDKIVFASDRSTVDNPTGDQEIFIMKPNGKKLEQLTFNTVTDFEPTLSSDGKEIAFVSAGAQSSNPEGDSDVYLMDVDGSNQENLTNTNGDIGDIDPDFSPDGQEIAFTSFGARSSNLEGDTEVYLMNALDGSGRQNLTDTADGVADFFPDFSPNGKRIAYVSNGVQSSNAEGDTEVYKMKDDGSDQKNLTDTPSGITDTTPDFSPNGEKIAYRSDGVQSSNPEGEQEVYKMKDDGSDQKNLTDTASGIFDTDPDFSPDGQEIAYNSDGVQSSNAEGDDEVYLMKDDGSDQQNLTDTGSDVRDTEPNFGEAKK